MKQSLSKLFSPLERIILIIVFCIYLHNLSLDIMQVDAAQYAGISSEMASTKSYLEVKEFQDDYLDKPPLLFWLSSIGIQIFGFTNFGYKIASFLFLIGSLFAVYRFSLLYYSQKIAKNSVLILATSQSYFLITNDVRTDSLLTSCTIIATWLISEYFITKKWIHLLIGSFFIGLAMLAKGPIGAIAVLMPIGINLMYYKKWREIFNFHWIYVFIVVALVLLPMSYGLYNQFDLHPEKGKKGLYFYYWLQSFGRITGENQWNNGAPFHFFFLSIIWDYFPWVFALYIALFFKIKNFIVLKTKLPEIITLSGFVLLFIFLSLSKYKLPHYIFVTLPFASVIVSEYLSHLNLKVWNIWRVVSYVFGIIILLLFILFNVFMFPEFSIMNLFCIVFQAFILFYFYKIKDQSIGLLISLVIGLNIFLSFVFYPNLLRFQADSEAGKWAQKNIKNESVYCYKSNSHAFNFYTQNPFTEKLNIEQILKSKEAYWIYVKHEDWAEIENLQSKIKFKKEFNDYPITRLKLKFLLANSREQLLNKNYLIKIDNQ